MRKGAISKFENKSRKCCLHPCGQHLAVYRIKPVRVLLGIFPHLAPWLHFPISSLTLVSSQKALPHVN